MRILHCIPTLGEGGSELQLAVLAAAQARAGDEVHLAVSREGARAEGLDASGVHIHSLRHRGNHDPMLYWRLQDLARRLQPDILQTWLRQMDILGGLAARRTGAVWVLTERSSAAAHRPGVKSAARALLARRASAIVSNSTGGDAYWASRVGPEVRRSVIGNVVPISEIAATPAAEDDARPPGQARVLYAGRLSPEKNLPALLAALRIVSASRPLAADFCGVGSEEARLRRLAAAEGLDGVVRFRGFVSPVWSLLKRADVFVSVSLYEGQPNAVLEAMAAGCPLVLSDIAAHRELLDERGAVFVDPSSPGAIAEGLLRCLSEPGTAAGRSAFARRQVAASSVEEVARRFRAVYEELLAPGRAGAESPCAG